MNNSSKSISMILAAGAAGVAAFALANSSLSAALPAEALLAIGASAAVLALAVYDYSRRPQSLVVTGRVLRPMMPATAACGMQSIRTDRLAA